MQAAFERRESPKSSLHIYKYLFSNSCHETLYQITLSHNGAAAAAGCGTDASDRHAFGRFGREFHVERAAMVWQHDCLAVDIQPACHAGLCAAGGETETAAQLVRCGGVGRFGCAAGDNFDCAGRAVHGRRICGMGADICRGGMRGGDHGGDVGVPAQA